MFTLSNLHIGLSENSCCLQKTSYTQKLFFVIELQFAKIENNNQKGVSMCTLRVSHYFSQRPTTHWGNRFGGVKNCDHSYDSHFKYLWYAERSCSIP